MTVDIENIGIMLNIKSEINSSILDLYNTSNNDNNDNSNDNNSNGEHE